MTARIGDPLPVPSLRPYLRGQNAPLTAQYTWAMLHLLPIESTEHMGSRQFRAAQREFWMSLGVPLDATRRDIQSGLAFLASRGALPPIVRARAE